MARLGLNKEKSKLNLGENKKVKLNFGNKKKEKESLKESIKNGAGELLPASKRKESNKVDFFNTGSTMLNLAASQKGRNGGWARGRVVNLVGDGSSGKTLLVLEAMANAFHTFKKHNDLPSSNFPKVTKLILVYDNVEGVMDFPIEEMYGKEFVKHVEWIQSPTCEAFGRSYLRRVKELKQGECLMYAGDSLDAMVPQAALDRIDKSIDKDKEEESAYGTEKAKFFSGSFFNSMCSYMDGKDATIFCISQLRENIGVSFGEKYKRTGGKALDFYTHQVVWLREKEKLKRTFRGHDRVYGVRTHARFKRSKVSKPFRESEFCILFDFGIDDIGSMVDFLYGPKVKTIKWGNTDYKRNEFIDMIEADDKEYSLLQDAAEKEWFEIEDEMIPKRKKRF
jgi:recombination protein RecA